MWTISSKGKHLRSQKFGTINDTLDYLSIVFNQCISVFNCHFTDCSPTSPLVDLNFSCTMLCWALMALDITSTIMPVTETGACPQLWPTWSTQIKSNQIKIISGNMAHKSYKLVQKQRQTEKERNKTHTTYNTLNILNLPNARLPGANIRSHAPRHGATEVPEGWLRRRNAWRRLAEGDWDLPRRTLAESPSGRDMSSQYPLALSDIYHPLCAVLNSGNIFLFNLVKNCSDSWGLLQTLYRGFNPNEDFCPQTPEISRPPQTG